MAFFPTPVDGILNVVDPSLNRSPGVAVGKAAIAAADTTGHLYIPLVATAPTGVPDTATGYVAIVYCTADDKLYVYRGAWRASGAFA